MSTTIPCARCGNTAEALSRAPVPGPFGQELKARVCAACWGEWQKMEVMVINELRLNFMDPTAQKTLDQHMRQFFQLDGPTPDAAA